MPAISEILLDKVGSIDEERLARALLNEDEPYKGYNALNTLRDSSYDILDILAMAGAGAAIGKGVGKLGTKMLSSNSKAAQKVGAALTRPSKLERAIIKNTNEQPLTKKEAKAAQEAYDKLKSFKAPKRQLTEEELRAANELLSNKAILEDLRFAKRHGPYGYSASPLDITHKDQVYKNIDKVVDKLNRHADGVRQTKHIEKLYPSDKFVVATNNPAVVGAANNRDYEINKHLMNKAAATGAKAGVALKAPFAIKNLLDWVLPESITMNVLSKSNPLGIKGNEYQLRDIYKYMDSPTIDKKKLREIINNKLADEKYNSFKEYLSLVDDDDYIKELLQYRDMFDKSINTKPDYVMPDFSSVVRVMRGE